MSEIETKEEEHQEEPRPSSAPFVFLLGMVLAFGVLLIMPVKYGGKYWASWSDVKVDQRLNTNFGELLRDKGISLISAPEFFLNTTARVYYEINGDKRKAMIHYHAPIDVHDAWITVKENSLHYRGSISMGSRGGNATEYDYHFEKASRLISRALAAVEENEENLARWR